MDSDSVNIENVYYSAIFVAIFFFYVGVRWCIMSARSRKLKNRDVENCGQGLSYMFGIMDYVN